MGFRRRISVVGWKVDQDKGDVVAFSQSESGNPKRDVELALQRGCTSVVVSMISSPQDETEERDIVRRVSGPGIITSAGKYIEPPLLRGVRTYHVTGWVHSEERQFANGRPFPEVSFEKEMTVAPANDVEEALKAGSLKVLVGTNYEQSEGELQEIEERKRRDEEAKEWMERESNRILNEDSDSDSEPH
jgi:hypothetical protein